MTSPVTLPPCAVPTLYFIGVTTTQSSIMKVFPKWSDILGLGAQIVGYDAPLHAHAPVYETIVSHIKHDPLAKGALVTTHKIDLLNATRDQFDYLDTYANLCNEVSCISKRDGKLEGYAKDPISSGLAWGHFVPDGHWKRTGGHVLCLGAGGAATAISIHAANLPDAEDRPHKFIVVDIMAERLEHLRDIHQRLNTNVEFDYVLADNASQNDRIMADLPPGSMVINATGMGKDRPGSPITDDGRFPEDGLVWELNYRGELQFLRQAKRKQTSRGLKIEDGWIYFLHGWTQVIAEVFNLQLTPEIFQKLDETARTLRPA